MSFIQVFGFQPGQPDEPEHTPLAWWGPPADQLGVCVPASVVIARSERGVVALSHVLAYSTGAQFQFVAGARGIKQSQVHAMFHAQHFDVDEGLSDEFLRIGVELSDGTRVSNLSADWARRTADETPAQPVFHQSGGGGGSAGRGGVWMRPGYWLWPLPPNGALTIWCEWPVVEIALAKVEVDASELVTAAKRSISLD